MKGRTQKELHKINPSPPPRSPSLVCALNLFNPPTPVTFPSLVLKKRGRELFGVRVKQAQL